MGIWERGNGGVLSHAISGRGKIGFSEAIRPMWAGPDTEFQHAGHVLACVDGHRESIRNRIPCGRGEAGSSSRNAIYGCRWVYEREEFHQARPVQVASSP